MTQPSTAKLNPAELLSDEDVFAAMQEIPGYIDISPPDFKQLYLLAYRHAESRLYRSTKADDIMSRQVITASPATPLAEVAGLLAENHITGLPVVRSDGSVAGIVSERDFFRNLSSGKQTSCMALIAECLAGGGCAALAVKGRTAEAIMTSPAVTVSGSALLPEISRLMREKGINRLPVIDDRQQLRGIITRSDLMLAFPERETP
ncbi:CBS domain-containing protein [Thiovibrio sp. JS02]